MLEESNFLSLTTEFCEDQMLSQFHKSSSIQHIVVSSTNCCKIFREVSLHSRVFCCAWDFWDDSTLPVYDVAASRNDLTLTMLASSRVPVTHQCIVQTEMHLLNCWQRCSPSTRPRNTITIRQTTLKEESTMTAVLFWQNDPEVPYVY